MILSILGCIVVRIFLSLKSEFPLATRKPSKSPSPRKEKSWSKWPHIIQEQKGLSLKSESHGPPVNQVIQGHGHILPS